MALLKQTTSHSLDDTVVFHVHGLTKVCQMGEVQVQVLRGVDLNTQSRSLANHLT